MTPVRSRGAVALVTLLLACGEGTAPPQISTSPLADSADQLMFGINTLLTDRGVLNAELQADTAFFFDENTRIELRGVTLTFYTRTGERNSVLTSREGTYNTRQSRMEARGNVVVVSEDGRRLTSEQLRYDQGRNEISSDSAFVLTEPGRRLEGIGFTSDPNMDRVRVHRLIEGQGAVTTGELGTQRPPDQAGTPRGVQAAPPDTARATPRSDTTQ
ncbi:MAG: LPS export ABC transporter periplasmic protein LptC [Gemmatimonadaceae bacterium]